MASEQEDPTPLPAEAEEWVTDLIAETGDSRETVLARAVACYRLLAEGENEDDALETTLSNLEARLEALESEGDTERIAALETELDEHVEDLRSRVVDVLKETRARAPADHSHEELDRLAEIEAELDGIDSQLADQTSATETVEESVDGLETEVTEFRTEVETRLDEAEAEVDSFSGSIETLETKADRLAGAVVDLRRRLERVESHITHQTALAELLETAARENIKKAECEHCETMVNLGMLVEPACPHCRSAFAGVEPGSMFLKSAVLTIADRPALEAGSTTEEPFEGADTDSSPEADEGADREER